jgi:hypothetical protein
MKQAARRKATYSSETSLAIHQRYVPKGGAVIYTPVRTSNLTKLYESVLANRRKFDA